MFSELFKMHFKNLKMIGRIFHVVLYQTLRSGLKTKQTLFYRFHRFEYILWLFKVVIGYFAFHGQSQLVNDLLSVA